MLYYETSALNGQGVEELFFECTEKVLAVLITKQEVGLKLQEEN